MVSVRYYSVSVMRSNNDNRYYLIPINEIEPDMLDALIKTNNSEFYHFLSYTYTIGDTVTDLADKWDIIHKKLEQFRVANILDNQRIDSSFILHHI